MDGEWTEVMRQETKENHVLQNIKYLTETSYHDIILCANHMHYDANKGEGNSETDYWMLIAGEELGLKTSTIDWASKNTLNVYPNPSTGTVNLTAARSIYAVDIYSLDGQAVYHLEDKEAISKLDIGHIGSGTYFLKCLGKDGSVIGSQKIIKVR